MVTCSAASLAAGIELDISQRMSSASTVARAIVDENVMADICLTVGRFAIKLALEIDFVKLPVLRVRASPERKGKSLWSTMVETTKKVKMNGRDAKRTVVSDLIPPPGLHSSQSLPTGSIDDSN